MLILEPNPADCFLVTDGLWQGAEPSRGRLLFEEGFRGVVFCAEEVQPHRETYPGLEVIYCPLYDDRVGVRRLSQKEWALARATAKLVAARVKEGLKVLVTCQAGINRSGVVSALTLHELYGWSGSVAAERVREAARGVALLNGAFCAQLDSVVAKAT